MTEERLLTKSEVAARLSVSERTIDRMVATGQLRATQAGNRVRFRPQDIEDYLAGKQPSEA